MINARRGPGAEPWPGIGSRDTGPNWPGSSRETSPGTAPDVSAWVGALEQLRARADDTLALELSVPFCVWQCLYCDREIEPGADAEAMAAYVAALLRDVARAAEHLQACHDVLVVHLGGGSPNHMALEHIERLVQALRAGFRIPAEAEWSITCDPRRCSAAQMDALHGLGFRHLQFGQADLDPAVQLAAGRWQSPALMADVMAMARESRFRSVQLELLCGLPGQTEARWQASIESLMVLAPDRIRCLQFQRPPPWMRLPAAPVPLPDAATCDRLWRQAVDGFIEAGYRWIGADLFVLDDDPLAQAQDRDELHHLELGHVGVPVRHHLAFGPGRVSDVGDTRAWSLRGRDRWAAAVTQGAWPLAAVQHRSPTQQVRRRAAQALRCQGVLPMGWVDDSLCDDLQPWVAEEPAVDESYVNGHEARGHQAWLVGEADVLRLTPAGRYHLDALCARVEGASGGPGTSPCQA